jgi:hypothetical protein
MDASFDPQHMVDIEGGMLSSPRGALSTAFSQAAAARGPVVLHVHGGLVSGEAAIAAANDGVPFYRGAGGYAIYPIWHTGLVEVLERNLPRIAAETLFKVLVDRVAGWVHGQVANALGNRGTTPRRTLGHVTVPVMTASGTGAGEFDHAFLQEIDFTRLRGADIELTNFDRRSITTALERDAEFKSTWDAVLRGAGKPLDEGARNLGSAPELPPQESLADRNVLDRLRQDGNSRGLGLTAAKLVVEIVVATIGRFVKGSDHGLHATTVEEVLRAVYVGAAGTAVWSQMKDYTRTAFGGDPETHAGSALVEALSAYPADQRVLLVGHSAGAIFLCELLKRLASTPRKVEMVLLAPAVRCKVFDECLATAAGALTTRNGQPAFRMFTMTDAYESKDTLIRNLPVFGDLTWFYPRSLLYFISGLLEGDDVDADLLGLERTHLPDRWYGTHPEVENVSDWMRQAVDRVSWAVSSSELPRMRTNSTSHGGFGTPGNGNHTMDSVANLLRTNWWD